MLNFVQYLHHIESAKYEMLNFVQYLHHIELLLKNGIE